MKYFELFTRCLTLLSLPCPTQFALLLSLSPSTFSPPPLPTSLDSLIPPSLIWVVYHHPSLTKKPEPVRLLFNTHTLAYHTLTYVPFTGNEEIENQLRRDKVMAKNEIKMLLLGAGESGKVSLPPVIHPSAIS